MVTRAPPKAVVIETTPRFRALLEWFEAHGALTPAGVRLGQHDLAERTALPHRTMQRLLKRMEELKVLHVQRTTVDGAWGSPRGPNIYRLLITPAEWEEHAEQHARETLAARAEVQSKNAREYHANLRRQARGGRVEKPATFVPIPDDVLETVAAEYDDDGDDLFGW